jgi:hypothetical protein
MFTIALLALLASSADGGTETLQADKEMWPPPVEGQPWPAQHNSDS